MATLKDRLTLKKWFEFTGLYGMRGRFLHIQIGPVWWDAYDWSLAVHEKDNVWQGLFSLRCADCRRFSCGCDEHWFCGTCQPCKTKLEADGDIMAEAWDQMGNGDDAA